MRLGLLPVLFISGCFSTGGSDVLDFELEKRTLSNGLKIYLVENHSIPVISYQSWIKAGVVDEEYGKQGIAHLFEHLMFKGTKKYGPKSFFDELESRGAEVNAYTTRDYTVYFETFTPNLLEKVIEMEADRLENLNLTQQIYSIERLVVMEERRLRVENSPSGRLQEGLWDLAFESHPYKWPVIGYPSTLLRITLDDLKKFFSVYYQPSNMTIAVVGDIDSDRTFELIKKYYGKIKGKTVPERKVPKEPVQTEERRQVIKARIASERFALAYHVTRAKNDESYALDVLANILFKGDRSRAHQRMVEEENNLLSISGSAFTPTYPGLFIVLGTMRAKLKTSIAEKSLTDLIDEIDKNGVTEEEVRIAVKQLTLQLIDSVRTSAGLAQLIGLVETILGDAENYQRDLKKYLQVKPKTVQKVLRKYLVPNNKTILIMEPE